MMPITVYLAQFSGMRLETKKSKFSAAQRKAQHSFGSWGRTSGQKKFTMKKSIQRRTAQGRASCLTILIFLESTLYP